MKAKTAINRGESALYAGQTSMKCPSQATATIPNLRTIAPTVAAMVAPVFVVPALMANINWSAGLWDTWNIAAASAVTIAPVFVAAVFRATSRRLAFLFGAIAALLITWNMWGAFQSATRATTELRDHRATLIATIERREAQRSRLSDGRKSAATVAGEVPAASIRAEIERTIAAGARRWASTKHCDPAATTATASIRLCEQVATLRGQLAAAERRDAIDAQLERLDREAADIIAPDEADPFTAAAAHIAAVLGAPMSPGLAQALPAIRDAGKALVLELIACFGPMAWMTLWETPAPRPVPAPVDKITRAASRRESAKPEPAKPADPFAAFVTTRLEKDEGGVVKAGDAFKAYQQHCAEFGIAIDANQQKGFGQRLGQLFRHDKNNGRPVYRGVRFRLALPEHVVPFRPRTA